ncbi:MAG TPA: heme o synthase [Planctomycetota bacterium]|nr:heme o synthase [Planctomycetota bacterium]
MSGGLPVAAIASARGRTRIADYAALSKPGITTMVAAAALASALVAARGVADLETLLWLAVGTALVGAGSNALNMLLEREVDARMVRTQGRPLPAGRMVPGEALAFGSLGSTLGVLALTFGAHPLAGLLGAAAVVVYAFLYTPLKRATSLCTVVGAVPGAMPALIGWAAVRGSLDADAWLLFLLVFFWQLPHFLAIAWMWREDYARGGFPMLPVDDADGTATGRQIVLQTLALLAVSLLPVATGLAGRVYFAGALVLGLAFLALGVRFALRRTRERASALFRASLAYLPALLGLLVLGGRGRNFLS